MATRPHQDDHPFWTRESQVLDRPESLLVKMGRTVSVCDGQTSVIWDAWIMPITTGRSLVPLDRTSQKGSKRYPKVIENQ